MAAIPGTNVIAPIVPTDTADVHPTHVDTYGVGGYRTVATTAERDAIPAPRRSAGMLVFVLADGGSTWRLGANLTTWSAVTGDGGGGGGAPASLEIGTVTTGAAGSQAAAEITGEPPDQVLNLTIPRGDTGQTGQAGSAGAAATVAVGAVTTGAAGSSAAVTNAGTSAAAVFNFTIPRGDTGAKGDKGDAGDAGAAGQAGTAATITVGTVTTGAAGSTVSVVNSGTNSAAVFDITIPRGDTGAQGQAGAKGDTGDSGVVSATAPLTYDAGTKTVALSVGAGLTTSAGNLVPDFGTTSGKVAQGNDSRFTDSRTPTAHESSHRTGGADEIAAVYQTVSQLTANADNLQLPAADTVFISSDAARTISGFVCTREQKVINNGAFNITILHDSASSSSANRVLTEWSGSYVLSPGGLVYLIPDPNASKIRAY